MLYEVITQGGDADTTGAIAGMLAGALYGEAAIPQGWLKRLDPVVRREVEETTAGLIRKAPYFTTKDKGAIP